MGIAEMYSDLKKNVESATAFRLRRKLQPAGGIGDKVFPPTYSEGKYALETRIIDGERLPCVILDSVQSQANRMELALLNAHRQGKIHIPVVSVNFSEAGFSDIGSITTLETPHRIADAIFRDSITENGTPFPKDEEKNGWKFATHSDATALFEFCPTGLLFGIWFNPTGGPGNSGTFGTRFQRAIVSEIIGVDIEQGVTTGGQSNPLGLAVKEVYYRKKSGEWWVDEKDCPEDTNTKKEDEKIKKVKISEINHGSVTPDYAYASVKNSKSNGAPRVKGGVTLKYALQTVVISLAALRRLSFPENGNLSPDRDIAARTVLAVMGLCAATLSSEREGDLRSRCILVPEDAPHWETVGQNGECMPLEITSDDTCSLLQLAVDEAKSLGLSWRSDGVSLLPGSNLLKLVSKSRESTESVDTDDKGE